MIVVEMDQKARRVLLMPGLNGGDVRFWGAIGRLRRQHNGGPVSVISTYITASVSSGALESYPDIRLNLFQHVPQMERRIGIG